MSRVFGPIRQLGYVTRDIHATMRHFVECLGIGPWFYAVRLPVDRFVHEGREVELDISVAIANSGALQLELIQPNGGGPSLFHDWTADRRRRELPQHISVWPVNYDALLGRAQGTGLHLVQEGFSPRGRFCHLLAADTPDLVFEFGEATPERTRIFDAVARAAVDWDGTDPIRTGFPG